MAKYYNTTHGSIAVQLRNGESASLPGKAWTSIASDQEGSEDVIRAVRKGYLVRSSVDDELEVSPVETAPQVVAATDSVADVNDFVETASAEEAAAETEAVGEKTSENDVGESDG